jgi:hypothetical protein
VASAQGSQPRLGPEYLDRNPFFLLQQEVGLGAVLTVEFPSLEDVRGKSFLFIYFFIHEKKSWN